MKSITASKKAELQAKKNLRKDKARQRDRLKALLDDIDNPEDLTKEEYNTAARQEQLHLLSVIELEDMDEEIVLIQNKLSWCERQTENVRRIAERSDTLRFRPFAKLAE